MDKAMIENFQILLYPWQESKQIIIAKYISKSFQFDEKMSKMFLHKEIKTFVNCREGKMEST